MILLDETENKVKDELSSFITSNDTPENILILFSIIITLIFYIIII